MGRPRRAIPRLSRTPPVELRKHLQQPTTQLGNELRAQDTSIRRMASSRDWFETVAEAQRRARKRLPKGVYLALVAGAEAGVTMRDNTEAFGELGFRPRVADLPKDRTPATRVMGQDIAFPVLISPTGVQGVDPEAEVAVARDAVA